MPYYKNYESKAIVYKKDKIDKWLLGISYFSDQWKFGIWVHLLSNKRATTLTKLVFGMKGIIPEWPYQDPDIIITTDLLRAIQSNPTIFR